MRIAGQDFHSSPLTITRSLTSKCVWFCNLQSQGPFSRVVDPLPSLLRDSSITTGKTVALRRWETGRTSLRTIGDRCSFSALTLRRGTLNNVFASALAKGGPVPSAPTRTRTIERSSRVHDVRMLRHPSTGFCLRPCTLVFSRGSHPSPPHAFGYGPHP